MSKIRIDRALQYCGFGSRKEVQTMLRGGRVRIGGSIVLQPDTKLNPWEETILVDGQPAAFCPVLTVLLYKPAGYLSATEDRYAPTVLDLLPETLQNRGLSPVGRLDKDTTGVLLLSDDGEAVHRLLSPKTHTDKTYRALLDKPCVPEDVEAFRQGIVFSEFTSLPAELVIGDTPCTALVTLHEGKFHQVKRMFHVRGKEVLQLHRLSFAGLTLPETMRPGEYRILSQEEWEAIRISVGLSAHPAI